jgi:hypothetical protein
MWYVETEVIPVITGETLTISKSFRKYLSNILGKHDIKELVKTAYWSMQTYFGKY